MRIAAALGLLLTLGVVVSSAMADKVPEAKDWGYDLSGAGAVVAEQEPNDVCPGQVIACGDIVQPATIDPNTDFDWYQIEATAGTIITAGTDADGGTPVVDTRLWIYADDCTTELVYNDDGGPGLYSLATLVAPYDGVYNIKVDSYSNSYTGGYYLFTECEAPQEPPVNDRCEGALALDRCTTGVVEGDLTWAANDYDPGIPGPSCTNYTAAGRDVTYVLDLLAGDTVDLFYFGGYDESFYIVTDCGDVSGSCVIGADATVGTGETINWVVPADGTYYLIVDAYGTNVGGPFYVDYAINCPVPAVGACCFDLDCVILTEAECLDRLGDYKGDDTVCDPNPCLPVPIIDRSWGEIKGQYR
jgi:hypothetical protein